IQNSKVQQFWTDIARSEEDKSSSSNVPTLMNFASGRLYWELAKCDDLGQLEDFDKYVNDMIKKQWEIIIQRTQENQKQWIFEKWIKIMKFCPLFTSTSLNCFKKDFIQRDILDPFYCLTIDLFHDFNLWKC
ncbi:17894_t:CDS:2, partial [Gigaspora rosea]